MLPYLAVKGRSRGACLVLAFQDIDGFREAAGTRIANEIIAQCSHKALLRMESDESAKWASRVIGQYETLDIMQSKQGGLLGKGGSQSEQAARRDTVLSSEFYLIPTTNPKNGLTGYIVSSATGVTRVRILADQIAPVISDQNFPIGVEFRPTEDERLIAVSKSMVLQKPFPFHQSCEMRKEDQHVGAEFVASSRRPDALRQG